MRFKEDLWTEVDPSYAPGLKRSKDCLYWVATAKYRDLGYRPHRVRLTGKQGDGRDLLRAKKCREHTRKMLAHFGVENPFANQSIGTWAWLIRKWKADPHARYQKIGPVTREGYDPYLARWEGIIGNAKIGSMTYALASEIIEAMKQSGRSQDDMKRMFGLLRLLARYAYAIGIDDASRAAAALTEFRFDIAPARTIAPTKEQVFAVIAEADRRGMGAFALGILIQWTYALRAVDVRGQWVLSDTASGIMKNGRRWRDGITWDMIDPDMSSFSKVISKTEKSMPEAMRFEITTSVRDRMALTPPESRVGPLIVNKMGQPYDKHSWGRVWRSIRSAVGLPSEIQMRDVRAGAITEIKNLGVDPFAVRDAAQHKNVSTTDRYARGRSENAAKVVRLRAG